MWVESGAFSEKVCYFWYQKLVILEAPIFIITILMCGAQRYSCYYYFNFYLLNGMSLIPPNFMNFFLFFIMKFDSTFHHLSPSSDHLSRLPLTISCIKPLWDLSGWIKIWFFHINMWTFFFFIMKSDLIQLDNLTTFDHTTNIFQNNYP